MAVAPGSVKGPNAVMMSAVVSRYSRVYLPASLRVA